MIITKDITRKDGIRTVTVQLAAGERLMAFDEDSYYRLGGQLDDVVGGYCITCPMSFGADETSEQGGTHE